MEEASGTQLGELWHDLDISSKFRIVDEIVAIEKKFLSFSFTQWVAPQYDRRQQLELTTH